MTSRGMLMSRNRAVIVYGICVLAFACSQRAYSRDGAGQTCTDPIAQPQEAIAACDKALSKAGLSPQDASEYLIARSRGFEYSGNNDKALADLDRAVKLDPHSYQALDARAQLLMLTQADWIQARKDADAAFKLAPEAPDRYVDKGIVYAETLDSKGAIAVYSEGIKRYPQDETLYLDRVADYLSTGDYALAMKDLDTAERLAPADFQVHESRAGVYMAEKQPLEAIKEYDLAMAKVNGRWDLLAGRCHAELVAGQPDKAIADCSEVLERDPGEGMEVYLYRGFGYLNAGKLDQARKDFEAELQLIPNALPARYGRALAMYDSGAADGKRELDAVLADDPDGPAESQQEFGVRPPPYWHKPAPAACTTPISAAATTVSH